VLIATAISSLLLISASRFLPGLQRAVLLQSGQRELEEEVWQRLFALGKQLQRAGYCAGNCQGQALVIGRQGRCVIVRWDANSNGTGITAHQKMTAPVFVWSRGAGNPAWRDVV
jgi:prepilin peptidase dependent protein B